MTAEVTDALGLDAPHGRGNSGSAVQQVYEDLRRRIITLELAPDTTLSRIELTADYGVSQTPIREAMQLLRQEGLVRIHPQARTVITRIEIPQIYEAHFLRVALETEVVRRLAGGDHAATVSRARSIIRMQEAVANDRDQLAIFQELDELFHQTLFAGVEGTGLHRLVRERSGHFERVRRLHLPERGKILTIIAGHSAIVDGIEAQDEARAIQAMRDHLSQTVARVDTLREEFPDYFA